jgi:methionyl-tRNA formyltransferase
VAEAARTLDLEVLQPEDVNGEDARVAISAAAPEAVCVCAFGALIREPLLSEHPMLNVHPSLLPRWRGAAPVERAIMAGDAETGVTIMRLTAGLDSGPIALQERVAIEPADTYGSLAVRLSALGGDLLVRALDSPPDFREQPDDGVTYAEKIGPDDRRLDPAQPAARLARVVRGLTPHIGAHLELPDGTLLGLRAVAEHPCGPPAGELRAADGRLWLGCASGALELLEVQPPGRRAMPAADYLRGLPSGLS